MAAHDEPIIQLEEGWTTVNQKGIIPFMEFIDNGSRSFFKAKDYVDLYDTIFKMCIQRDPYNWSKQMYDHYTESIKTHLDGTVAQSLTKASKNDNVSFLKEWQARWKKQKLIVKGLKSLFMYLDRFWTPNNEDVPKLEDQGFMLYKESIFNQYCPAARNAILDCVEKERDGQQQDCSLLQEAVGVFVEMGRKLGKKPLKVYRADFEKDLVEHAGAFYKRKSRLWLDEDSCPMYLEKVERVLDEERSRVENYMDRVSVEPVTRECHTQLLKTHQTELLTKKTGVNHMLSTNSIDDLTRLYKLYARYAEDLDPIADLVHNHIKAAGTEIVDKAKPGAGPAVDVNHELVRSLIDLHAQYNKVVSQCFERSPVFQKALKKAFEDFVNQDNRVSMLLAKYVNDVLKKGTKVGVKDVDGTLDNVVFLYGYIQDKDIFERDYQINLAKRLVEGLCESEHAEKSMIAKLKTECGYQWTNKLEGMFKDVQLSKELMGKFNGLKADTTENTDLEVIVCTTGYWPSGKPSAAKIPEAVLPACNKFKQFYLNDHQGRKLDWRLDSGQAEITVDFASNVNRGLTLTTYQMMIMLVFNSSKVITFKEICDVTGIPVQDIKNHLLSLCHPKVNVLQKRPNNRELEDSHKFKLNNTYKSNLMMQAVPLMKAVEASPEQTQAQDKAIQLQRRHQMDASIVRIMKTRKSMNHPSLVSEVAQQLQARFKPKPNDIKKRIEALIEQDYLERDPNNRSIYNYLA